MEKIPNSVPWKDRSTETGIPAHVPPTAPDHKYSGSSGSWMASGGLLFRDRGYPVCHWPTVFRLGNHVVHKEPDSTAGYPHLLAKEIKDSAWTASRNLWKHCVPVPGLPDTYWIPNWYTARYLAEADKVWNGIAKTVLAAAANPSRYLGLREAHRVLHVKPWITKTLDANYPDQHALAGMGYTTDRDALIDELTNNAMLNYPSPQDLVDATEDSRPHGWSGATPDYLPPRYSMYSPARTTGIAVAAADKHKWATLNTYRRIKSWLSIDPRTGKYPGMFPASAIRVLGIQTRRLAEWEGPGEDKTYTSATTDLLKLMSDAPGTLRSTHVDNELRKYFLQRFTMLEAAWTAPDYNQAKLSFWLTGNPAEAPQMKIVLT